MNNEIGLITEQGDLGLGFNPLSEQDAKIVQENQSEQKDKDNGDK